MKQVFNYQEGETLIDKGKQVIFTCFPEVRATAAQKYPDSDAVTVTIELSISDGRLGMLEFELASILEILDASVINDPSKNSGSVGAKACT